MSFRHSVEWSAIVAVYSWHWLYLYCSQGLSEAYG